ncbi:MAG: peptidoglycan DD-metalloendopeptidase family protein [Gammaproteobacteria bacterium]|nr:MAG: peptidoglycan DD-metalloendopeptidase family protein [Gammaproteobacteria bacterium]
MGRVKSQLKHDYKPGRPRGGHVSKLRWRLLAVVALAPVGVLLLSLPEGSKTGDGQAVQQTIPSPDSGLKRVRLQLPGQDARAETGLAVVESEVDTGVASAKPELHPVPMPGDQVDALPAPQTGTEQVAQRAPEQQTPSAGKELVVEIKPGDSLDRLFRRHGLSVADLALMLELKEARNALAVIKPGDKIEVTHEGERVLGLSRPLSEELTMRVVRSESAYEVEFMANPVEHRPAFVQGEIETSLFEAGAEAGMSDRLIMNLAGVFAWDVDFALEIRKEDRFSLVYQQVWQDGERLRDGDILAAEFVNQGRVYRALRFEDPEGRVDYYTPEGLSVRKAFLRAPLDFTRVSSNFNPNRLHPILKTKRPHKGVDYAAPKGTPIKAAGDGRIIFRGRNGGYGNCVIIQHGGNITTLYAHLSKFARGRNKGTRVRQGQVVGYVGATGLATAAHLHYEYRLNGVHRNPRTVPLPEAEPVSPKYRDAFMEATQPLVAQLDAISDTRLARLD